MAIYIIGDSVLKEEEMAVPARKVSKTRKRMRRAHNALAKDTTIVCENCKKPIKPHRACKFCGFYKGKEVLNKVEDES